MRIGIGYDIHRFIKDRPLILGGIEIPFIMGLDAHSDGDVVGHAICDAILGAAGMGDIGEHFPVNDDTYAGISSTELLKKVREMIRKKGFRVDYVDSIIILEEPKITPFKNAMKKRIAEILNMDENNVNIKATTQEGIGAIGRGEAASAYAVACVRLEKPETSNQ